MTLQVQSCTPLVYAEFNHIFWQAVLMDLLSEHLLVYQEVSVWVPGLLLNNSR